MNDFLGTIPGGAVTGAVYALLAMGLVFIYKATKVPNFAYGAMATFIAFFHYDLVSGRTFGFHHSFLVFRIDADWDVQLSFWAAMPFSLALGVALGLGIERFVIRPFARASMVTNIIVTLGLSLLLSALTQQLFGADQLLVPNQHAMFPRTRALAIGGVAMSWEQLGVLATLGGLSALVWWFFRSTATGLAIRATATDRDVASLLGVSARRVGVISWVSSSLVAGLAGIALASLVVASDPNLIMLLSVKGFAAAIVGGLTSFPIAIGAALAIGWVEELTRFYLVDVNRDLFQGAAEVLTLGAVIAVLAARPRWIFAGAREDQDGGIGGTGVDSALSRAIDPTEAVRLVRAAVPPALLRVRWAWWGRTVVAPLGAAAVLAFPFLPFPDFYTLPVNLSLAFALVLLSYVVLVGWLGQVSLAQGAFVAVGGAGTVVAANELGLPFPLPIAFAALVSVPVAVLIGLPALRLRGLHLAIATMAFGLAAERAILPRFTFSSVVRRPAVLSSDARVYYLFLIVVGAAVVLCVRIQRTRVGRSFAAIRDSELVATAYGIDPVRVKLTGFVVSGVLASVAGSLLTYQLGAVNTATASVFFSISWLANGVVGGIGAVSGAFVGAGLFGLYPELSKGSVTATSISFWPQITSAALLIAMMAVNPGGLASMSRFVRARSSAYADDPPAATDPEAVERAPARVPEPPPGADPEAVERAADPGPEPATGPGPKRAAAPARRRTPLRVDRSPAVDAVPVADPTPMPAAMPAAQRPVAQHQEVGAP